MPLVSYRYRNEFPLGRHSQSSPPPVCVPVQESGGPTCLTRLCLSCPSHWLKSAARASRCRSSVEAQPMTVTTAPRLRARTATDRRLFIIKYSEDQNGVPSSPFPFGNNPLRSTANHNVIHASPLFPTSTGKFWLTCLFLLVTETQVGDELPCFRDLQCLRDLPWLDD